MKTVNALQQDSFEKQNINFFLWFSVNICTLCRGENRKTEIFFKHYLQFVACLITQGDVISHII